MRLSWLLRVVADTHSNIARGLLGGFGLFGFPMPAFLLP
jgi:hypothetical protein